MRNLMMLAVANVRKRKSQATSLILFVLLAAMFLNIGLVLLFDYTKAFDERARQLNAPHLVIIEAKGLASEAQFQWLSDRSQESEQHDVITGVGEYWMSGSKTSGYVVVADAGEPTSMNPVTVIGDQETLIRGSILVPYALKMAGYQVGDQFRLVLSGSQVHYRIAGFTEDVMIGTQMNTSLRFYLATDDFNQLSVEFPQYQGVLLQARLSDTASAASLSQALAKLLPAEQDSSSGSNFFFTIVYDLAKDARTFLPSLMAVLVMGFAIILLAINLLVMRFGIVNNIEESTLNIGVQKAVGFRNRQIVGSILTQFASLAAIGAVLGIGISVAVMPFLARLLESQSAMIWKPEVNWAFIGITLGLMILAVMLVAYLAARRTNRLHPLVALRGGLSTHSFKKNHVPLDRCIGPLSFLLGLKRLLGSPGQATTIAVIVAALSFACVSGVALYYNVGVEDDQFMSIIGGELPDVSLTLKDASDFRGLSDRLMAQLDVRKVYGYQGIEVSIDDVAAYGDVADFSLFESNMIVEGRFPRHANEVAVGNAILKTHGKKLADTITLTQGGLSGDYIITGLIQAFRNNGQNVLLTYDGALRVQPSFEYYSLNVYLNPGVDVKTFITDLQEREGEILSSSIDMQEMANANLGQLGTIFGFVAGGILVVTVIIVALTLYLVIKTTILRLSRELGIQKAIGFTTWQIMNQLALALMPVIAIAVVVGSFGAVVGLNPFFASMTSSFGIVRTDFQIPFAWAAITGVSLVGLANLVCILVALRTRKITAYALVTE